MNISDRIYKIVRTIPRGKVMTYGEIAKRARTSPHAVGNALHRNPDPKTIPCHRVVNAKGELSKSFAFGGMKAQKKRLENEDIRVKNGRVDLPNVGVFAR
jgi:methylated-DNA-protein-cysteine methyltransferase-like protein